jgi:alcohol dehydrogenase
MDLQSFQHIIPPLRLYSGADSLKHLGRELERLGSARAVIFCGSSLARSPLLDLVRGAMGERCAGVFASVRAHSPRPAVEAAAAELKRLEADAIVAVGGGSAIVTARAASIFLAEGSDLERLCTSQDAQGRVHSPRLLAPKLSQLIVLTTPTTAAVKAGTAVFDPASARRFALFDPKTRVQSLFIHPELIKSAPRELVVSAGLDTLSLAIEGLTSLSSDPLADALLVHAVRLLSSRLPDLALGDDARVRGELALAAVLCGQGTDHTGAGIATVLGHAIGANLNVENGVAKAIVLPHALRFNAEAAESGLRKVAVALGLACDRAGTIDRINDSLGRVFASVGSPRRLRDVGVTRDRLPEIAARGVGDWFLRGNPRPVSHASELQDVLEQAW